MPFFKVQELHHGLVAFCSELKSMDLEPDVKALGPGELGQRLESAEDQLLERSRSLQNLKENIGNATAQGNRYSTFLLSGTPLDLSLSLSQGFTVRFCPQACRGPPHRQDEAELSGVQGGDLPGAPQQTGGPPQECSAGPL